MMPLPLEEAASKVNKDAVFFKTIKLHFVIYLFTNCFDVFINFNFSANFLKMNH